jgi:hypothetical protein
VTNCRVLAHNAQNERREVEEGLTRSYTAWFQAASTPKQRPHINVASSRLRSRGEPPQSPHCITDNRGTKAALLQATSHDGFESSASHAKH